MDPHKQIAIIGMGGIFPGAATPEQLWHNLLRGVDSAAQVPPQRWSAPVRQMLSTPLQPDRALHARCCLAQVPPYEGPCDTLPRELIAQLDPLYHLVLHAGHQAIGDCRAAKMPTAERVGVILAAIALPTESSSRLTRRLAMPLLCAGLDEGQASLKEDAPPTPGQRLAARVTGLPAALLARALGFAGLTFTLDAACASSLYALYLACDTLLRRRADLMLAGGVSRPDCLYTQVGFSQLQALSTSGRCAPFDTRADGLMVGEGAGVLALKRLADALADGDRIWGVIRGIGLSNDMRGNLLAPETNGQLRAMRQAYDQAGLAPGDIDHIECHGAGTVLGDATELESLRQLWGEENRATRACVLGSVKSHIGHLLTAAGAAGTIKTLLAMAHGILPPTLHFQRPAAGSPLEAGPFRVLGQPEPWPLRDTQTPRRAAVSAFGFGGINAHLILEQWQPVAGRTKSRPKIAHTPLSTATHASESVAEPIAIVGMGAALGRLGNLAALEHAVLRGEPALVPCPPTRWPEGESIARRNLVTQPGAGAFLSKLTLQPGQWRIPPREIPDILPQHLLMLRVGAEALADAGLATRQQRPSMGVLVGIDFDAAACRFQLRWQLEALARAWLRREGQDPHEAPHRAWIASLCAAAGAPLTASRTLGALGSLIASRMAREFHCGGASFTLSAGTLSGLVALESAVRLLQRGRLDSALVGAVDLAGDLQQLLTAETYRSFTDKSELHPLDRRAGGTLPGEGAVALVLKPLSAARADGDRIYAVIRGLSGASGPQLNTVSASTYRRSLNTALVEARLSAAQIDYLEAHGSGDPREDEVEAQALAELFSGPQPSCAIGALKAVAGHAGAAAGLAGVVKTALCLQRAVLPPLPGYATPAASAWQHSGVHVPLQPQPWLRDRAAGPRRAVVAAMDAEGGCCHVVLEDEPRAARSNTSRAEFVSALLFGQELPGLFVVPGADPRALLQGLDRLETQSRACSQGQISLARAAHDWRQRYPAMKGLALLCQSGSELRPLIATARQAVTAATPLRMGARGGVHHSPQPLEEAAALAFVYPGSGSHYAGMGREWGLLFPEQLEALDAEMQQLRALLRPWCHMPWQSAWPTAGQPAISDVPGSATPLDRILGQIGFNLLTTRIAQLCGLKPAALIGYSLGESAALAAMGLWPDRDGMLAAVLGSELFTHELAGECRAARKAWGIGPAEDFRWCAALVNRPAAAVKRQLPKHRLARLLIVNGPEQCVVGGEQGDVQALTKALGCTPLYLEGLLTVHCDALQPVAEAWRALHRFPTSEPGELVIYGGAAKPYRPSPERVAASILRQGLHGLDFSAQVMRAWQDGLRCFVEMGPQGACSAMIERILGKRAHLALSLDSRSEPPLLSLARCLGSLVAEGMRLDIDPLLQRLNPDGLDHATEITPLKSIQSIPDPIVIPVSAPFGAPPPLPRLAKSRGSQGPPMPEPALPLPAAAAGDLSQLMADLTTAAQSTTDAHRRFLGLSSELLANQARLLALAAAPGKAPRPDTLAQQSTAVRFTREMCLEFAVGSAARVLGPEFAALDRFAARVRLPNEPLMLVDRILAIEGQPRILGPGRIVTEHDVRAGAWYLDGGCAPAGIAVEAGQADLFLCSYLGIDLRVEGRRNYRLLDATVAFHRGLPRPGETIRYDIRIERFIHQADAWMFFFHFDGTIDGAPFITMTRGCAGFFTPEEVRNSGGILPTMQTQTPQDDPAPGAWLHLTPAAASPLSEAAVEALRRGELAQAFGQPFEGITLPAGLRLPGGRLNLIRRVPRLEPRSGRHGLGLIQAETDIYADDWFLACHFIDDMTMPGTLMYEGSLQALRILLLRQGLVSSNPAAAWEPLPGAAARLKCRGPVSPATRRLTYEVQITELGFGPEPYALADALLSADGRRIVLLENISLRLSGGDRQALEAHWGDGGKASANVIPAAAAAKPVFSREQLLTFALGNPSEAFGEPYRPFDRQRVMARLPNPPYLFMDRVERAEPPPWELRPDGWVEAAYDVPPDAWYFRAEGQPSLPYAVINEVALQPCGWLAAWMGSALKSPRDLKFRNLGGKVTLHRVPGAACGTLRTRARLTQHSQAGDLLIEHFEFQVHSNAGLVYDGQTYFGFFTQAALAEQVGLRNPDRSLDTGAAQDTPRRRTLVLPPPLAPEDPTGEVGGTLRLPAAALGMIARLSHWPRGGPAGLGFVRAEQAVDPLAWYFKAHFYQDPVCPGSLGLESLLQVLKVLALERWPELAGSHAAVPLCGISHQWTYRGQVLPTHRQMSVEVALTQVDDGPRPFLLADGRLLVDGLPIYAMGALGLQLIPREELSAV